MMPPNAWRYYSRVGERGENASLWIFTQRPLHLSEAVEHSADPLIHFRLAHPLNHRRHDLTISGSQRALGDHGHDSRATAVNASDNGPKLASLNLGARFLGRQRLETWSVSTSTSANMGLRKQLATRR
jgi:hypothetical protein